MNEKKTYEFDVVTEYLDIYHSVENLKKAIPTAEVKVRKEPSPGGGWVWLFATVDESDKQTLLEWYFGDAKEAEGYDIDDFEARQDESFFAEKDAFKTF